jgi:hypothetical protein
MSEQENRDRENGGGDNISVGNISGTGIAVVRGAQSTVNTGDTYSGDFRGAIMNVRSTLKDVTQSIGAIPLADDDAKAALKKLTAQLDKALAEGLEKTPDKAEDVEAVVETTKAYIETASAEKPNKTMLNITKEGLMKAAKNIAEVMPTVLKIATEIVAVVGAFA